MVPMPPEDLTFACSAGVLAKLRAAGQQAGPAGSVMCKLKAFGANGQRPSPEKKDFPECQAHCLAQGNGAQVAEPRSVDQLQFLARVQRKSVRTGTPSRLAVGRMGFSRSPNF